MKSTGYIVNGKYVRGEPKLASMVNQTQSTWKAADHESQRRQHARDIIQPLIHGKPNPEFIQQYPEEAKQRKLI